MVKGMSLYGEGHVMAKGIKLYGQRHPALWKKSLRGVYYPNLAVCRVWIWVLRFFGLADHPKTENNKSETLPGIRTIVCSV